MKKVTKIIVLMLIIGFMLILLAGCGNSKLVATKTTENDSMGTFKEEIVMNFKKDKVTSIESSMEFDNEDTATSMYESMYAVMNIGSSVSELSIPEGIELKQDGKKVIMTMDAKTYAEQQGASDEEMTKEALRKVLEEEGYTVK